MQRGSGVGVSLRAPAELFDKTEESVEREFVCLPEIDQSFVRGRKAILNGSQAKRNGLRKISDLIVGVRVLIVENASLRFGELCGCERNATGPRDRLVGDSVKVDTFRLEG